MNTVSHGMGSSSSTELSASASTPSDSRQNTSAAFAKIAAQSSQSCLRFLFRRIGEPILLAASAWDRFWYTPADPIVLSFMRLFVGGMLVYTHVVWGLNLPAFLGNSGWNPPEVLAAVQESGYAMSFWWYVPEPWFMTVHCVCVAILVLFWLGFATRLTSILSMIITVSYSQRAHMANFGLDQINAILCFYLCIGPSGAFLSVDRWLSVWKARRVARAQCTAFVLPPIVPSLSANLAIRLTQLHFCVIYSYAGLSKLQGNAWWNGEAVWLAFANLEYQSCDMTWIAWYPWISDLMTHSTIVWEVFFAALVWVRPIRPLVLFIGCLLHLGIGGMMGLWTFGLIMIFGHLSFWPVEFVRSLLARLPGLNSLTGTVPVLATSQFSRPSPRTSSARTPALLLIDRDVRGRLRGLSYFLKRGYRCLVTDDIVEAQAVREATSPDAVILMGNNREDEEVVVFHNTHFSQAGAGPLFVILPEEQSNRLNGRIHTPGCHVLTGAVTMGNLRREIQETLLHSRPVSTDTARVNNQVTKIKENGANL